MRNPNVTKTLQWTALILVLAVTSALVTLLFLQQRQYRTEASVARAVESAEATPEIVDIATPEATEPPIVPATPEATPEETEEAEAPAGDITIPVVFWEPEEMPLGRGDAEGQAHLPVDLPRHPARQDHGADQLRRLPVHVRLGPRELRTHACLVGFAVRRLSAGRWDRWRGGRG